MVTAGGSSGGLGDTYAYSGRCTGAGVSYCTSLPNSASSGGVITSSGSTSIAAQDLTLMARFCPPNQPGLFYYGSNQVNVPLGDGIRCAGGATFRINPPAFINGQGLATRQLDWSSAPIGSGPGAILPGSTWNFSFWFRDPNGPGGTGFNYTDGRSITFCP